MATRRNLSRTNGRTRRLTLSHKPRSSRNGVRRFPDLRNCLRGSRQMPTIAEWERILLEEALRRYPTKTQAAAAVGLTRQGFGKKIDRMGL